MTSVALPVVRGPFALAKTLVAIDVLSEGRLDAGLGPGSSEADYALAGIPFTERWARFDESVAAMRALWDPDVPPFVGRYYDTTGVTLSPPPAQPKGPPIWIGSWGSTAGLRRVARLADGWLASGYNTTPETFAAAWRTLSGCWRRRGGIRRPSPARWPRPGCTSPMRTAEARAVTRAAESHAAPPGRGGRRTASRSAHRPHAWISWGATGTPAWQRVLLWPVKDEVQQLERVALEILPQLGRAS